MKNVLKRLLLILGRCGVYLVLGFIIFLTVIFPIYLMLFWPGPG